MSAPCRPSLPCLILHLEYVASERVLRPLPASRDSELAECQRAKCGGHLRVLDRGGQITEADMIAHLAEQFEVGCALTKRFIVAGRKVELVSALRHGLDRVLRGKVHVAGVLARPQAHLVHVPVRRVRVLPTLPSTSTAAPAVDTPSSSSVHEPPLTVFDVADKGVGRVVPRGSPVRSSRSCPHQAQSLGLRRRPSSLRQRAVPTHGEQRQPRV